MSLSLSPYSFTRSIAPHSHPRMDPQYYGPAEDQDLRDRLSRLSCHLRILVGSSLLLAACRSLALVVPLVS